MNTFVIRSQFLTIAPLNCIQVYDNMRLATGSFPYFTFIFIFFPFLGSPRDQRIYGLPGPQIWFSHWPRSDFFLWRTA